jgi:hypothetical protein
MLVIEWITDFQTVAHKPTWKEFLLCEKKLQGEVLRLCKFWDSHIWNQIYIWIFIKIISFRYCAFVLHLEIVENTFGTRMHVIPTIYVTFLLLKSSVFSHLLYFNMDLILWNKKVWWG